MNPGERFSLDFAVRLPTLDGRSGIRFGRSRRTVDYGDADGIVGALNDRAQDPDEWVVCHRRNELCLPDR